MKKIIRLAESDLHRIVNESVKRILREKAYDINSPEYKQMYDDGLADVYDDDTAQTDKEIANYETLPDKARHPYGADIPDFSNRRDSHGDKLSVKKPNSVLDKLLKKKNATGQDGRIYSHKGFLKNLMGFSDADATEMANNGELMDNYNAYLRNASGYY